MNKGRIFIFISLFNSFIGNLGSRYIVGAIQKWKNKELDRDF